MILISFFSTFSDTTEVEINQQGEAGNEFMKNSVITGNVMEFTESVRHIRGNFRVENPQYILTAGQGMIDVKKDVMEANINVRLIQENNTLTCAKLIYYMAEERAVATGNPKIVETVKDDSDKDIIFTTGEITGDRIINYLKDDMVVVEDNVRVEKMKIEDGKQSFDYRLYCDNLTYYNKAQKAIAIGNVKIEQVESTAFGDRLVFYELENRVEIVGNAFIERDNGDKVYGEKIVYFMNGDRVLIFNAKAEVRPSIKQ